LLLWGVLWLPVPLPAFAAPSTADLQRELHYQVSWGVFEEVGRCRATLKPLGPGHYQAEFSLVLKGPWRVLSRFLPEQYQTEIVYRQGRLQPLLFREKIHCRGKTILKEYRFNYAEGRLELWRKVEQREMTKEWEVPLKEPVYDPLSLLLNFQLGMMAPGVPGQALRVAIIPTPDPGEMIIHMGPETPQGRKLMVKVLEKATGKESEPFFVQVDQKWLPTLAWVRLPLGTVKGRLVEAPGGAAGQTPGSPSLPKSGAGEPEER
jgi:hypothetical protein